MDTKTKLELDLEEAYNDFDLIDMELQTAVGKDRHSKLNLKKAILSNIRRINDKLNRLEDYGG